MTTAHDAWIAAQNANISDFARTQISESELAAAASGDYYAQLFVATEVSYYQRMEALSDAELVALKAQAREAHYQAIELDDPSEYDVNDHESFYAEQYAIEELLAHRAAQGRYTNVPHLTHNPFAGLRAA